ncbi:hypothetical protein CPB86DRAFT_750518 [Serendipita vermifera]|nr:hypothetical protein CPB86DRAFT_750518 [Serendipita vermifera]
MAPSGKRKKGTPATQPAASSDMVVEPATTEKAQDEEKCPGCSENDDQSINKDTWICCDACKTWYHWGKCSGTDTPVDGSNNAVLTPEQVDKWFCKSCIELDPSRTMTLKPPPRKSARKRQPVESTLSDTPMSDAAPPNGGSNQVGNSAATSTPGATGAASNGTPEINKWIAIAEGKTYSPDNFRRMNGSDIGMEWILRDESAMKEPIVIEDPEGLGMKMPSKDMTVRDVANQVGPDTHVEVIDVLSQSTCPGWTLGKWADYYHSSPIERDRIRNVISLEVSGTALGQQILPPRLVRELDWVEKHWPSNKKQLGHYPKVQLYCLMSVAQSWTDWHIDFAGSSVYYHVLQGTKVFYFIKPTTKNLAAYEHWSGTDIQNHTWLGDMADEVVRVELTAGNTMIIPTGWIHAVYTPADSLVFGGNFVHSLDMKNQLRVQEIEIRTRVPKKFRFPMFTKLCWYAGEHYCRALKAKEEFAPRILRSLDALAMYLVSEARIMERGSEAAKKEARENVPADKVKDPSILARELRWRVRNAAGVDSDAELGGDDASIMPIKREPGSSRETTKRRKRDDSTHLFKNWQPPEWSHIENSPLQTSHDTVKVESVANEDGDWMSREGLRGDVMRSKKVNGITKVRKLDHGAIERYSVIRTVEYVTPSSAPDVARDNIQFLTPATPNQMLVDYGSDSEASDDGQKQDTKPIKQAQPVKAASASSSSLSAAPPKPRRRDGPLKITVEAPKRDGDDPSADSRPIKRTKLEGAGASSLLSMLPAPKNKNPVAPKRSVPQSTPVAILKATEDEISIDDAEKDAGQASKTSSLAFIPPSRMAKGKSKVVEQEEPEEDFFSLGTTSRDKKNTLSSITEEHGTPQATIKSTAPSVKDFVPPVPTQNDPYPGYYMKPGGEWAMHDPEYYWSIAKAWQQPPGTDDTIQGPSAATNKRRRDWEGEEDDFQQVSAMDEASRMRAEIENTKSLTVDTIRAGPTAPNMAMTAARSSARARSRHQLSTLLTDAYSHRAEIEEKIAMAKRNRKESGNKYGF